MDHIVDQRQAVRRLLEEMDADSTDIGELSVATILDYMAICGLAFTESKGETSRAYQEEVADRA